MSLPAGELRPTLRRVTERLALALCDPHSSEPDWSDTEWRLARAMAIVHGIAPLLASRLSWNGGAGWRAFLELQRLHTAARQQRIEALFARIAVQAADEGVEFITLKGQALHRLGIYLPGERPMADLDLLVRPSNLYPMSALIRTVGYEIERADPDEHVLVPVQRPARLVFGEHADSGITVEIHTAIRQPMPIKYVDITARLWPVMPGAEIGRASCRERV